MRLIDSRLTCSRTHLDWTPSVEVEDGLKRTIAYFRDLDMTKYKSPTNHTAHRSSQRENEQRCS